MLQTDADRRFLAAKGSVPIGIGKSSHIKRAIIDKNARIGDNVKVRIYQFSMILFFCFYLRKQIREGYEMRIGVESRRGT